MMKVKLAGAISLLFGLLALILLGYLAFIEIFFSGFISTQNFPDNIIIPIVFLNLILLAFSAFKGRLIINRCLLQYTSSEFKKGLKVGLLLPAILFLILYFLLFVLPKLIPQDYIDSMHMKQREQLHEYLEHTLPSGGPFQTGEEFNKQ